MKTLILSREQAIGQAAEEIGRILKAKPNAVVALAPDEECLALYERLAAMSASGALELSETELFIISEFEGLDGTDPRSCEARVKAAFAGASLSDGRFHLLSCAAPQEADEALARLGGLDLAILGIGWNARLGFNEPATPFDSRAHLQKLAPATRRELAALFGGEELVPVRGVTLGIRTLTEARRSLVLAFGEEKAKAAFDMLYARNDSAVPAAFLQIPSEVTVYLDEAAAAKL